MKLFDGYVKNYQLEIDRRAFNEAIKNLNGKKVEIILREYKEIKLRRAEQYAFLFGYVYEEIADQLGYTKGEVDNISRTRIKTQVHNSMKLMVNPVMTGYYDPRKKTVIEKKEGGTTTGMSRKKLSEFTEQVMAYWSSEHGVIFADTKDNWIRTHADQIDRYYKRL